MIKLWKDEEKNRRLREIIEQERVKNHSCSYKYQTAGEKTSMLAMQYGCSLEIAKKAVWILTGDAERQFNICNQLGPEYAKYTPTSYVLLKPDLYEQIKQLLEERKAGYDLDGVDIVQEDIKTVARHIQNGKTIEEAVNDTLSYMREILNEELDEPDFG